MGRPDGFPCPMSNEFNLVNKGNGRRAKPHSLRRSERGSGWRVRRQTPGQGRRAERDSLARSERGVWGVRRSTPQLNQSAARAVGGLCRFWANSDQKTTIGTAMKIVE